MSDAVLAALIAALPATLAAYGALRANRRVRPVNGSSISQQLDEHTRQDQANFEQLRADVAQVRADRSGGR